MRKITFGQFLLLIFALTAMLAFITGVHGFERDGQLLRHHGRERPIALVAALFCFTWFFGLRRRLLWAWYIGCAVLLLMILQVGGSSHIFGRASDVLRVVGFGFSNALCSDYLLRADQVVVSKEA